MLVIYARSAKCLERIPSFLGGLRGGEGGGREIAGYALGTSILERGGPAGLSGPWKVWVKEGPGQSAYWGLQLGEGKKEGRGRSINRKTRKEGHLCWGGGQGSRGGEAGAGAGSEEGVKVTSTTVLHTTPGLQPSQGRERRLGEGCTREQRGGGRRVGRGGLLGLRG